MSEIMRWSIGLDDYKTCIIEEIDNQRYFTTILNDREHITGRSIPEIFYDHLDNRQTKYVEVLFSGGIDSELVLRSLIVMGVPCIAVTMELRYKDVLINSHDIFYAEKFCRENNIKHQLITLNVESFFSNGDYLRYLEPYFIVEPHVATHFWLIEQCEYFPIFGGDWPWVHTHKKNIVLSPIRLEYSCYELFMKNKGIFGISNMIGHSFESIANFFRLQLKYSANSEDVVFLKHKMYSEHFPNLEPRLRSYGWENIPRNIFNKDSYKVELIKKNKITKYNIVWGKKIQELLNTDETKYSSFK